MPYVVKFFPSSIVSGSIWWSVSGRISVSPAARRQAPPNMDRGIAVPDVPPTKSAYQNVQHENIFLQIMKKLHKSMLALDELKFKFKEKNWIHVIEVYMYIRPCILRFLTCAWLLLMTNHIEIHRKRYVRCSISQYYKTMHSSKQHIQHSNVHSLSKK